MVLIGLKVFQDAIVSSISNTTTRVNCSFLRTRITASSVDILKIILTRGQKRGSTLAVQYQRQSEVTEWSNEKYIVCYNF